MPRIQHRRTARTVAVTLAATASLALASGPASTGAGETSNAQVPPEVLAQLAAMQGGAPKKAKKDFPPFSEVIKGYEKVISTADGQASLYTLYKRDKDAQMLAVFPAGFENQRLFIATTIAGGTPTAGIQFNERYVYWKRFDRTLALIEPNVEVRSSGDAESRSSRDQLFTDRVILSAPIVTMSPGGGPVIDLDGLLVGQAAKFFGWAAAGANGSLSKITRAKAFPNNVEVAFRLPVAGGRLTELHYSISVIPNNTGYKPREADERVGYFTTSYRELARPNTEKPWVRYINRWHLQKADPSLRMSPPKEPIVFYIEHTTPIRWRRWVREGLLAWNEAFEQIGIVNAIEVYQQDARTGAHMEKDPEDVRYNFIRWNTNGQRFAIGPSRVDPRTGQILDADIVMNDGLIATFAEDWRGLIADLAIEGFSPETLAWLNRRPNWDPRYRLATPQQRAAILAQRARALASGELDIAGGHPAAISGSDLLGDNPFDGLAGRTSQVNGHCCIGAHLGREISLFGLGHGLFDAEMEKSAGETKKPEDIEIPDHLPEDVKAMIRAKLEEMRANGMFEEEQMAGAEPTPAEDGAPEEKPTVPKDEEGMLDGLPEDFIGPLIRYIVSHEAGHTLGLRHNFKASTMESLSDLNDEAGADSRVSGSVMEYLAVNINAGDGPEQGPWTMPALGPYDLWAIEFGYTLDNDLDSILSRVAEEDLAYATDEDTWGPDPRARRWDLGADPLNFADSRMRLVERVRPDILERAVDEGDSWSKSRDAYMLTLAEQVNALSTAANWVGGSFINRDKKGDPADRLPIENIPAETQRRALEFVIDYAFFDDAFGLTPELLSHMTVDKWWDQGGFSTIFDDPTWTAHDTIMSIQSATLSMVMNPTTLRRIFDNELRATDDDVLTLPEVLFTVSDAIWMELESTPERRHTAANPMISSLRRNLQREHVERLVDLSMPEGLSGAAAKPIANLSNFKLRQIREQIDTSIENGSSRLDPYTLAHLSETGALIDRALDAAIIYNASDIGSAGMPVFFFGAEGVPSR